MIGTRDIKVQAASPNIPLQPIVAFRGSPISVRLIDVPKRIGQWKITEVFVTAAYPDNSIVTKGCVLVGGCWVATLAGKDVAGKTARGFTVTANGIDEDGNATKGYVLAVGDLVVLDRDATPAAEGTRHYIHLLAEKPESPNEGDAYMDNALYVFDGAEWVPYADERVMSAAIGEVSTSTADLRQRVDSHAGNASNPHNVTAEQVNAYTKEDANDRFQPRGDYASLADVERADDNLHSLKADRTVAGGSNGTIGDGVVAVVDASGIESFNLGFLDAVVIPGGWRSLRFCELLLLNVPADGAVTLSLQPGTYQFADGADKVAKGNNHFCFAEYATNCWLVSKSVVAEASTEI